MLLNLFPFCLTASSDCSTLEVVQLCSKFKSCQASCHQIRNKKIPHWFGLFKTSQCNTESPAVSMWSCSAFFFHLLYNHNTVSQHIPFVFHSLAYWQMSLYSNASAQRKTRSKSHYRWSLIKIHLEAAAFSRVWRHSLIMKCQGKKEVTVCEQLLWSEGSLPGAPWHVLSISLATAGCSSYWLLTGPELWAGSRI